MEAILSSPIGRTVLSFTRVSIGRLPANQIVLTEDTLVSGRHAEIIPGLQGYTLLDLGSMNGTFVNERRLIPDMPWLLCPGDKIRIGKTQFTFEAHHAPAIQSLMQRSSQPLLPPQPQRSTQPLLQQQWQPPQYPPPPQTYYPPSTANALVPQQKQPAKSAPKSPAQQSLIWRWLIIGFVIGLFVGYAVHVPPASSAPSSTNTQAAQTSQQQSTQANPQPTQAPTQKPQPTQPPHVAKWITVQKFSGNGKKKTAIFNVPNDWKILWSCYGFNDGSGIDGAISVTIYDNQNNYVDEAVNATCKAGSNPTTGETEEHQSGSVYLSVDATGNWSLQVQELQ